jgi:hypothetical protein
MRLPVQLHVALRPSPTAAAVIVVAAVAAFAVELTLPTPWLLDVGVGIALGAWAIDRIRYHALRTRPAAIVEVMLSTDAVIVVRRRDGKLIAGHVRSETYVHPWFTSIVWRPDRSRRSRALPIVPDMADVDEFRRLRVLLRYGRREVAAGAPASHA